MQHPESRNELLAILENDQREVRACSKAYKRAPKTAVTRDIKQQLMLHSQERTKRMLQILDEIGAPTTGNVGADGSQAISVLALHSQLSVMKEVLDLFEKSYEKDPGSVYLGAIPSLADRILVIERRRQRFGTQWMLGADGKFFLPPVEDFEHLNQRRAVYGLGKSRHPIDLTNGVPEYEPPRLETLESDQRPPTDQEYKDFVYGSLD
jgi:hypothetical protein